MASNMTHLSLFSGIGGIDLAAEWAGFESVAMVERDKYCQKILAKNFPNTKIHDDVTTLNANEYRGKIDLLSAGFPCQPHSLAGKRQASGDERDLWSEVVRIIRDSQPRWFLGENVRGLLSSESGKFFGRILDDLEEMGYRVGWCLYGAKDIGAVHRRERVFIVAYSSRIRGQAEGNHREGRPFCGERKQCYKGRCERCKMVGRDYADNLSKTNASDTDCIRQSQFENIWGGDWRIWDVEPVIYETETESRIRGAHDGIPNRVDRLRALGNAVVPQQVYPILAEIAQSLREEIDGI